MIACKKTSRKFTKNRGVKSLFRQSKKLSRNFRIYKTLIIAIFRKKLITKSIFTMNKINKTEIEIYKKILRDVSVNFHGGKC